MEVTGLAGTDVEVAGLIATLARSPLIQGVDLVYSEEKVINQTPVRAFQVRVELKADGDAVDLHREAQAINSDGAAPPAGGPTRGQT